MKSRPITFFTGSLGIWTEYAPYKNEGLMTAPTTEQPPNQWDVLVDFVKTMVTLATGLLALTVTFADKMTMGPGSSVERWPLIASWSLLLAATLFGVLAAALVTNYLRHGTRASGAIFLANGSFFLLLLAGGAFLVLGIRRLENSNAISASEAVSKAIQFMPSIDPQNRAWQVDSLAWSESTGQYRVELKAPLSGSRFSVSVSARGGSIVAGSRSP